MIKVTQLLIYPFKSAQGIALPKTGFDAEGLLNDRRLMAVDENGGFLTARRCPELLQISCQADSNGWTLAHPAQATNCSVAASDSSALITGKVWKDDINAIDGGDAAANWISEVLGQNARVALWKPTARHSGKYALDTSFADAAPILIVSEASMQQGCDWAGIPYDVRRFRPNIVINGVDAFEEENWKGFQIGDTHFKILDTCSRCILTTRDPDTGEAHADKQPMKVLMEKHKDASGQPVMGMNATLNSPMETAFISVGDEIIPT